VPRRSPASLHEHRAQPCPDRPSKRISHHHREGLGGSLHGLQGHVAGEPVGDHHVDVAPEQVAPLAVAFEPEPRTPQRRGRRPGHLGSLGSLLAVRQERHSWPSHAQHAAGVDLAHEGELDQVKRPAVDVGARVEHHRPSLDGGEERQDGGPLHVAGAPEHHHGPCHHGAAVPGAHHGRGLTVADQLQRDPDRAGLLPANGLARVLVHPDGLGRVANLDRQVPAGALPVQLGAHPFLGADQDDGLPLARCVNRALNDGLRGVVAPHGIYRDGCDALGHRALGALGNLTLLVEAARRANPMRHHRLLALRAQGHVGRRDLEVGGATTIAPHAARSLLGNSHGVRSL
jgi:hypothetical protein